MKDSISSHTSGGTVARAIALYLPQYHPIPENDAMWGPGFTEWRTITRARSLYPGHKQPRQPADLGFYDLRLPEVREAQAELARTAGIEGFCYYHYWFGGKRLLERPFNEVLASGKPDFPFCLCWANESWTGVWVGKPDHVIREQTYPGDEEQRQHFEYLLRAFNDPRYIRVDGKPVFFIYRPLKVPDTRAYLERWREMAARAHLPGLYLVAINHRIAPMEPQPLGFDAVIVNRLPDTRPWVTRRDPSRWLRFKLQSWRGQPTVYDYADALAHPVYDRASTGDWFPTVYPNWDTSPRHGKRGLVMHGATPALFRRQFEEAVQLVANRDEQRRIVILKSWNEWAEGNYVEPDAEFGHGYLTTLRAVLRPTS